KMMIFMLINLRKNGKIPILRACLEVVLLKRKCQILGSHEGIFPPHSSATGRKNGKVRFQKLAFAAKMTTSKHALRHRNRQKGRYRIWIWPKTTITSRAISSYGSGRST